MKGLTIMKNTMTLTAIVCSMFLLIIAGCSPSIKSGPAIASTPPANAIVIFDGTNLDQLKGGNGKPIQWKVADGTLEIVPGTGSVLTKEIFRDFHMHLEFLIPEEAKMDNSGIYIHQRYEVQIIDSYEKENSPGMCASLYRQKMPDFNVCKPPGQWQTYEIIFRASRWDGGKKIENGRLTLIHNGTTVHNNIEITNKTGSGAKEGADLRPILFQDHKSKVKFRSIWIVPMPEEEKLRVPKEESHAS